MTRTVARKCVACGVLQPKEYGVPDPCLGTLPGVLAACCGHGTEGQCYIMYDRVGEDGYVIVRGEEARRAQLELDGSPAEFTRQHASYGPFPGWVRV